MTTDGRADLTQARRLDQIVPPAEPVPPAAC